MGDSEKTIQARKQRLVAWAKEPSNFLFIAILIAGIIIRLYYFSLTKSQPLWWDEADYMAYAKSLAGLPIEWSVSSQHNTLFYYFAAFLFKLAFSEAVVKFILEILPSVLLIPLVYFICLETYKDKRVALISAFLMATFWAILFNSMRFHLGVPALLFGLLAIYVFWTGYEKNKPIFGKINPKWAIPISAVLTILSYGTRRGYFVFGFFFLAYMLITRKFSNLIKDKQNWTALVIAIALIVFLEFFAFLSPITHVASKYTNEGTPFNLLPFDVFKAFFQNPSNTLFSPLFYLFWIGFIMIIISFVLTFGHLRKMKGSTARSDLFFFLTIAVTLSYFLFYQHAQGDFGEPRWYFPLLLGSFICISRSTIWIADFFKQYHKALPVVIIIALIGYGGYYEMGHANAIIDVKTTSFEGVKQAGLHINSLASETDAAVGYPTPILAYYSERNVSDPEILTGKYFPDATLQDFIQALDANPNVRFVVVYFFEPALPEWMRKINYAQNPQTGQTAMASWEIPFMDSTIDFTTGQQDIKSSKSYGPISFSLSSVNQDTFVYEVIRS